MRNTLAVILGGGRGTRLYPLTKVRSKPAVPLAGKYRLIDIPVSNCLHSNITRIFVLVQFHSASLIRHIRLTYNFDSFRSEGFVHILAAEQTESSDEWFRGTADAVRKTLRHYYRFRFNEYLVLSGDHIYRMDYRKMIEEHRERGADITMAALIVPREKVPELGVLEIDEAGRIIRFVEKPRDEAVIDTLEVGAEYFRRRGEPVRKGLFLGNMGVYLFRREVLEEMLQAYGEEDFGKHILPLAVKNGLKVYSHLFDDYWEDIGTIRSFYEANLAFVEPIPQFSFYDEERPIFTRARYLPPSKITRVAAERAMFSEGCIVEDAIVERSIIGVRSIIRKGAVVRNSYVMGSDYHESPEDFEALEIEGLPPVGVGENSLLDGVIVDKDARIGRDVKVIAGPGPDREGEGWMLRDGVVVIEKEAVIPDGTVLDFSRGAD